MPSKSSLLIALALVVLLFGPWYAWLELMRSSSAMQDAHENLSRLQALKGEIAELRSQDLRAHEKVAVAEESSTAWLLLGQQAGISDAQFTAINRSTPQRIEKTDYSRDDLIIQLSGVSLEQLVKFALLCEQSEAGYKATVAQMKPVGDTQASPELVNSTLTLTRVLYNAKNR